jgi:hypothetical protein
VRRGVWGEGCREASSELMCVGRGVWGGVERGVWVWGGGETKCHGAHLHGKISSADLAVIC